MKRGSQLISLGSVGAWVAFHSFFASLNRLVAWRTKYTDSILAMLQAFKNDTLTDLQVRTLSIREKELNFWNMCLSAMAKQGALIAGTLHAGFTYGGLAYDFPPGTSPMLMLTYLAITVLAMSCELITVTIATFCTMFGPGLALRGPEGATSMHKAVDVMQEYARASFSVFMLGLVCFHLSSLLLMWMGQLTIVSITTNIVLIVFLVLFFKHGFQCLSLRIYSKLYVHHESAVSGKFENFAGYEDMPALDRKQEPVPEVAVEQPKSSFMWLFR